MQQTIKQKMKFPDTISPNKIRNSVAKVLGVADSNVLVAAASCDDCMRRSLRATVACATTHRHLYWCTVCVGFAWNIAPYSSTCHEVPMSCSPVFHFGDVAAFR